jgi:hypothetical protein
MRQREEKGKRRTLDTGERIEECYIFFCYLLSKHDKKKRKGETNKNKQNKTNNHSILIITGVTLEFMCGIARSTCS